MICKNCGKEVSEGKFCELCGAKLDIEQYKSFTSGKRCPNCGEEAIGKFCGKCGTRIDQGSENSVSYSKDDSSQKATNIFNNIGGGIVKQFGNLVTNITAIKSGFKNDELIYKVEKLPSVKEKKIIINTDEIVYIDISGNVEKHSETFTLIDDTFSCFYINKETKLDDTLNISVKTNINKLNSADIINLSIAYNYSLKVTNTDGFFDKLIKIKNASWVKNDLNEYLFSCVGEKCSNKIAELLAEKGGLDLRDINSQVRQFTGDIKNILSCEVSKLSAELCSFDIFKVDIDIDEVNNILIANLYK